MKRNPLKNKRCYLSGPIEFGDNGKNWRTAPTKILHAKFGLQVYDPFADPKQQWKPILEEARQKRDFPTMVNVAKKFVHKDLGMVDRMDLLVAYLPYKVCTTGTHHEITTADRSRKPTLLVCPQGKEFVPLWYFGFIPTEFMFGSWKALYKYLGEVNGGEHLENSRWDFIYEII